MKKWLLFPVGLIVALMGLAVLAGPGLIGAWLPGQVEQSLESNWPDATPVIRRGWFGTSVVAQTGTSRLKLDFRHLPWWRGTLLTASGELILTEPEARIGLDGVFSLSGEVGIDAESHSIRWAGVEENRIEQMQLALRLQRGQQGRLHARANALILSDPLGNRLDLRRIDLESHWQPSSEDLREWALDLQATAPEKPASRLLLNATSMDAEALSALSGALYELNRAPPESLQAQMAGLGLLGAWQQLVQAGLKMELNQLSLDQQIELSGQWQPNLNEWHLIGGGANRNALEWLGPIIGLSQQRVPQQARIQAWQLLESAEDHNQLTIRGEQFEFIQSEARQP